jgi:ribonucleotide monophosphatase NagD (HAD superfamily)
MAEGGEEGVSVLTNNSAKSREELAQKLKRLGIEVDPIHLYTTALATASFLAHQNPVDPPCHRRRRVD